MTCCFCGDLCRKAICMNKPAILKRINGQVGQAASLRTMQMAVCCTIQKGTKLASYDRVLRRLKKGCA